MAAAWAVMHHLGDEGYLRLTAQRAPRHRGARRCHHSDPELTSAGPTRHDALAFGAADPAQLDVFAVADALWRRGWYVDRQGPPDSLHCTVNAVHDGLIPEFVAELRAAVDEAAETRSATLRSAGDRGAYGTVE